MSGRSAARAALGRRDANHAELSKLYENLGCSVVDSGSLGFGFPDAIVGAVGTMELVEFKTEDGVLEASQQRFARDWRGPKPVIIRTAEDVFEHVAKMRKRICR